MHLLKNWIESILGLHIYRSTLPHGASLLFDFGRAGLRPGKPVIFDIGAHKGQTALAFLQAMPTAEIHCFEPASSNFRTLREAVANHPQVALWKLAMSDCSGTSTLHLKDKSTTHSLVHADESAAGEPVEVETLDRFCERQSISRVHFCKIDTEGADLAVLKGARNMLQGQMIDFVQVETSTRPDVTWFSPFAEVNRFLLELGYELFGFYEQQQCWTGRQSLLFFNAVYVRTSLVDKHPVS